MPPLPRVLRLIAPVFCAAAVAVGAEVSVNWLDKTAPGVAEGVSFGVPWPQGAVKKGQTFSLKDAEGKALPAPTGARRG